MQISKRIHAYVEEEQILVLEALMIIRKNIVYVGKFMMYIQFKSTLVLRVLDIMHFYTDVLN